jgi:hypothetical protein
LYSTHSSAACSDALNVVGAAAAGAAALALLVGAAVCAIAALIAADRGAVAATGTMPATIGALSAAS